MSSTTLVPHRALLKAGVATALLAVAMPAVAQEQEQAAQPIDTIVVTGSRIARPNLESTTPMTIVGAEEVQYQGITRTEDLINSLPQVFSGQGGHIANGASGTATVDLRGLGASRTLVLVNGRRLMPGDPTVPFPDLNTIPAALIERVDILTGGASTVYGSDAVAGVVNFVMDTTYEGFKVDAQYSFYQHNNDNKSMQELIKARNFELPKGSVSDGGALDLTATIGLKSEDGRGHIVAYAGYRKINAVLQAD
ncbi:MAG TPA: TonB-dependent receptor plug domain-containing protein, partial [Pedomonas sp.]|nr:TonB-dependent receptor plug domain-containing protein [Pedomonas sp.]